LAEKWPIAQKLWPGMSNAQNIHQKNFGDIGTKIDGKNAQFEPPIDPYKGGVFVKSPLSLSFYVA
jgi:hypothetical protein